MNKEELQKQFSQLEGTIKESIKTKDGYELILFLTSPLEEKERELLCSLTYGEIVYIIEKIWKWKLEDHKIGSA